MLGLGLAENVYLVEQRRDSTLFNVTPLGAVASGEQLPIFGQTEDPLRDHNGTMPARIVITEAMATRTQQWIVTLNVLNGAGDVRHRIVDFNPPSRLSLQELLAKHGDRFVRELGELQQEVSGA
jgi:hypothetical protein